MPRDYTPVIPKAELVDGAYYEGRCRNATVARWDGTHQCFVHWRTKFGSRFLETIRAPEDDQIFDVFVAERRIEAPAEEIPVGKPPVGRVSVRR